jgi:hypothetical protein
VTLANTRNDIINEALDLIGVKASDESASASETSDSATALDHLVKTWQSTGAHLWSRNSFILFLQPAQIEYQIGPKNGVASSDNATEEFTETTLSAAASSGDVTVSLTSSTGLAISDFIGIEQDDGTIHWTTAKAISVVTLNDALTDDAASGNTVYFYTTKIGKALKIPDARREQGTGTNAQEIEMVKLGRIDYLNLPNKKTSGTPVQFYYDPKIDHGLFFAWPAPTSTDTLIRGTYYRPLNVFDDADDSPDFPDEWIEALKYHLAVRMAPRFGQPVPTEVAVLAISLYKDALEWDQGDESIFFQVGFAQ